MEEFEKTLLIGVIFDLSSINDINLIKDYLLNKVLNNSVNTKIYIYNLEWNQIPKTQGESTYYIATYKENLNFKIDKAFKDTVTLIGQYEEDCEKYIYLFTSRFGLNNNFQYKKGFLSNHIQGFKTKIKVFALKDMEELKEMAEEFDSSFVRINDIKNIKESLNNE